MNKIRMQSKLKNFLAIYKDPGIKPGDKKQLLSKINTLEKNLGLPLTQADKNLGHFKNYKDNSIPYELQNKDNQRKKEDFDINDVYLKRYRYSEKLRNTLNEMLNEDEKKYLEEFEAWYKEKESAAKKKIQAAKIFPFIESNVKRKVDIIEAMHMLNNGYKIIEVAEKFGVTRDAINYHIITYYDFNYHPINEEIYETYKYVAQRHRFNGLELNKACELMNKGLRKKDICERYGFTQSHGVRLFKNFISRSYKLKPEMQKAYEENKVNL